MKRIYGIMLMLCCMSLCACSSTASPKTEIIDFVAEDFIAKANAFPVPTIQITANADPAAAPTLTFRPEQNLETEKQPVSESPAKDFEHSNMIDTDAVSETPAPSPAAEDAMATFEPTPAPVTVPEIESEQAMAATNKSPSRNSAMEYVFQALARIGLNAETTSFRIRVTHNTSELFSCVAEVSPKSTKSGYTLYPVTVDMKTGAICELSDFFSPTETGWKSLLPDLVTKAATAQGMTLLCEVPPVNGDQPFYIEDGEIVLVYRPYEITTYDAGEPCFSLPMKEIAAYTIGAFGIGG